MKCKKGFEVKAYKSEAGWYVGTIDEGFLHCRITSQYAKTKEEAERLPLDRQFGCNEWCNGGYGCFALSDIHTDEDEV